MPQLPAGSPLPPRAELAIVSSIERYGWVWVCLDSEPAAPIPDVDEYDRVGWRAVPEPESVWDCAAGMLIDNNLDPGHIAFVHRASFGTPDTPEVPVAEVTSTTHGLRSCYEIAVKARPGEHEGTVRRTTADVLGPFLLVIRIDYPDGVSHVMIKACTPIDDGATRQFQLVLRNDTEHDRPAADIVAFDAQVWEEDRRVLEHIADGFHIDVRANIHLKTDRTSIEYRRYLARLIGADRD